MTRRSAETRTLPVRRYLIASRSAPAGRREDRLSLTTSPFMTEGSATSEKFQRIDPPELLRERRKARRMAASCANENSGPPSALANAGTQQTAPAFEPIDIESTLREQLDAHARSLGEALISRQAEIDRREADTHARLADLESMRRELELWSEGERSNLAAKRAELEERSTRLESDAGERRRELDRREETLASAFAALERTQAKIEELQRRCEEAMRRFDSDAGKPAADLPPLRRQASDASTGRMTEAHALVRELAGATAFRIVRPDANNEGDADATSHAESPEAAVVSRSGAAARTKPPAPAVASHDLIRLHEALLDKERFLADEARKLERERKAFAELRMTWIEERLQNDRKTDGPAALAELRVLRAEIDRERQDRVQVQKRRHQRMQHLLEAIEDEITRPDIAWASVPQR